MSRRIRQSILALVCAVGCKQPANDSPSPPATPATTVVTATTTTTTTAEEKGPPPEIAKPFPADADAEADLAKAIAVAAKDGKPILLLVGANWCAWCRRLESLLQRDPTIVESLTAFHFVHVDIGDDTHPKNADLSERFEVDGVPAFVLLDAKGKYVRTQSTDILESGDRHDPKKVLAFLHDAASS
jgi:thiol:disulfide interchange protein